MHTRPADGEHPGGRTRFSLPKTGKKEYNIEGPAGKQSAVRRA